MKHSGPAKQEADLELATRAAWLHSIGGYTDSEIAELRSCVVVLVPGDATPWPGLGT